MITKKALKHNARFWENECDKYARLYYQSLVEIERLKKEISTNQDFFRDLLRYGKIKSDVDVVPRAEVTKLVGQYYDKCDECRTKCARAIANEIFEEIEREIVTALRSNYSAKQDRVEKQIPDDFVSYICEGKIAALRGIDNFIAKLKNKYTEGEK